MKKLTVEISWHCLFKIFTFQGPSSPMAFPSLAFLVHDIHFHPQFPLYPISSFTFYSYWNFLHPSSLTIHSWNSLHPPSIPRSLHSWKLFLNPSSIPGNSFLTHSIPGNSLLPLCILEVLFSYSFQSWKLPPHSLYSYELFFAPLHSWFPGKFFFRYISMETFILPLPFF